MKSRTTPAGAASSAAEVIHKPSLPGFSTAEALELLGMSTVANFLGPVVFPPFPLGLEPTDDPDDPLPNDDGATYAYPRPRIWPAGWGPGVPSEDEAKPWKRSILTSRLSNGAGLNSCIIAHNAARNAYAIAFAGTLNPGAAMQDVAALFVPAGPMNQYDFRSQETYISEVPASTVAPAGGQISSPLPEPPTQVPGVHLGYRLAVESLTVQPVRPANLKAILQDLPEDEIELYVTGHSLGAAAAQLFSAWVQAGGVTGKTIHVKCYSFATPKSANTTMASNYNFALANHGFSYRVENTLDTAPQLPPTHQVTADLINPAIASDLNSKAEPTGAYVASPLAPLVKMILGSGVLPGGPSAPAAGPAAPAMPFPFSILADLFKCMPAPAGHPAPPPSGAGGPPAGPPPSMDFVGMGMPHTVAGMLPVIYNGKYFPSEFFPGRRTADFVEIPDATTRQWWQHWPYNYAKYLLAHQ